MSFAPLSRQALHSALAWPRRRARALLAIPPAKAVSYAQVASAVGNPKAARAVGLAVGASPVALMIPCHRVIQQNGKLGGYHWGETRKQAIHAWEAARYE